MGLRPSQLDRIQPYEVWALQEGSALEFSRVAELVSWGVWMICCCMPFSGLPDQARTSRIAFLKSYPPPGFIPPTKVD